MAIVAGHKGISSWRVTVTGHEAHSSLTHLGISANMVAVRLMQALCDLAERLAASPSAVGFTPPHATLTIGQVAGGTAVNILARRCEFVFDLRTPPGEDPDAIIAPFLALAADMDGALRQRFPEAGVTVARRSTTPALAFRPDEPAERLLRSLTGDNAPTQMVSYAAEAGQFQQAGFSTVICGPGSIEQAHQPDEYLEVEQVMRGAEFMRRLGAHLFREK